MRVDEVRSVYVHKAKMSMGVRVGEARLSLPEDIMSMGVD
jgi:hypothetical protein